MGNGRWLGQGLGENPRKSRDSDTRWLRFGAVMALVVLLIAGSVLLGLTSRSRSQMTGTRPPVSPIPTVSRASVHARPNAKAVLGELPLIFEANQGQADPAVKFLARGAGYSLLLDKAGALLALQTAPQLGMKPGEQFVRMKLAGANPQAVTNGAGPLPGRSNYFIGNDPRKWHSDVPQFARVRYENVYPGIDLVFYGNQGHLEYDFHVAPGSDPSRAELQFDEASKLELEDGDLLVVRNSKEVVRLRAPRSTNAKDTARVRLRDASFCAPPTALASRLDLTTVVANSSSIRCSFFLLILAAAGRRRRPRLRSTATALFTRRLDYLASH